MSDKERDIEELVVQFMDNGEIGPEYDSVVGAVQSQHRVFEEEVDELDDEYLAWYANMVEGVTTHEFGTEDRRAKLAEELADVRVTIDVLAAMLKIDIVEAERKKMEYNCNKSSEKDDKGKVVDNADIEKPDFTDTVGKDW
jgi:NTP pyrophosphatase (non-canonical NTP hydrolase)